MWFFLSYSQPCVSSLSAVAAKKPDIGEQQEGITLNGAFLNDNLLEIYGYQGKHLDSEANIINTDLSCQDITILE